ncbi:siderophore-interacting protein [Pseudogemmobacter sonorensis]|uniref:siderophore-interacting protein n=1 Tax=Pseudogemmobacter sonorensis TaxID=2989681 RepID=UPI0036AFF694
MQTIHAQIHDTTPAALLPSFTEFAKLLDLEVETRGEELSLPLSGGRIGVMPMGSGLELVLEAENERRLYMLQQVVMNRLDQLDPVPRLEWERVDAGALPPNLSIAAVEHIRQISPNFRRVRLRFDDVARYAGDGLHFRLVISAQAPGRAQGGSVVEWPVIDPSGRTRWPEGEAALHRPVYTVREIDARAGWMDFDVYIHDGGRVSAWTGRARPGDRIGLLGPTTRRSDLPGWLGFFGDETAIPAIALYLASLPETARGVAVIACADLADRQELRHPPGVRLDWITRAPGVLALALKAVDLPEADRWIWFGAEREEADAARRWLREERGFAKAEMNVTAFWSQSGHGEEG